MGEAALTNGCGFGDMVIPWSTERLWWEIQEAFHLSLHHAADKISQARQHAKSIAHELDLLADWFEQLAGTTCRICEDPCCRHAKVWLDFRDLLFIHLHQEVLPPRQLRGNLREPCRYLGDQGCSLPQRSRPWICTWYICPSQRRKLERDAPWGSMQINAALLRVKAQREALEKAFMVAIGYPTTA